MIVDMDIIMTDAGQIVLVVPGIFPAGDLQLGVDHDAVTLAAAGKIFVRVEDIDGTILDTLAQQNHIDLISVPDADHPPAGITHQAGVKDYRLETKGTV